MNIAPKSSFVLNKKHLLGIEGLSHAEISGLLDLGEEFVELNRQVEKKRTSLRGRTQINLFFEVSTRTQSSFELAGKRLGADVMNMSTSSSSMRKGETLIDTAITLNAMHPDILVVRHGASGAVELLASKLDCSVINAGDGSHEHPTQALLDAYTLRERLGDLGDRHVVIVGDITHSRVARSNVLLLTTLGARVTLVAPPTLMPSGVATWDCATSWDLDAVLSGKATGDVDAVMMLRVQRERMNGGYFPTEREYAIGYGLSPGRLDMLADHAPVLHPGPMNRGLEISSIAADSARSMVLDQVQAGVAVRMAVLYRLLAGAEEPVLEEASA